MLLLLYTTRQNEQGDKDLKRNKKRKENIKAEYLSTELKTLFYKHIKVGWLVPGVAGL